jgi:serpin B
LFLDAYLDALTRLVLVNAIYFKGNWDYPFEPELTKVAPFWLADDSTVQVPMMNQQKAFNYFEDSDLQILELPYLGNGLSMLLLLPQAVAGLTGLEVDLTVENLNRWTRRLRSPRLVNVFLPKFKASSSFALKPALAAMGMPDAFDIDRADFSGMDGRENWLYIGDAFHKAFVDVNEEGTEAAAATAVVMALRSEPPTFRADHPFVFLIRENSTGAILFLGRVVNPMVESG